MTNLTEVIEKWFNCIPPEPEAHCFNCIQARDSNCAEFNALNRPNHPYDREWCHWGAESKIVLDPDCLGKLIGSVMCDPCLWRRSCGKKWYETQSQSSIKTEEEK